MDALQKISQSCMKNELPSFEVGDTVRVQVKIKEGDKERLQAFEGTVIGIKKAESTPPSPFVVFPTAAA